MKEIKGLCGLFVLLFVFVSLIENTTHDEADARYIHGWIQALSSVAWPEEWEKQVGRKTFWFSFATTFNFLLAIGPVIAIFDILWRLISEGWREQMRLIDAFKIRDELIKHQILNKFDPSERARIEEAVDRGFEQGSENWEREQLPIFVGKDKAQAIKEHLRNLTI